MNSSNAKDYLPLVQALAEGKVIQRRTFSCDPWKDCQDPDFTLSIANYRIKPEPREIWVNHYHNLRLLDQICHSKDEANNRAILGQLFCQKRYREVIE